MTQPVEFSPYSSVQRYVKTAPAWVPVKDQQRIASYQIYTEIYWSHVAGGYKVMNRGLDADDEPLYVPSSRIMVDTLNRYVGTGLTFAIDPATGSDASKLNGEVALNALFARERFSSRYAANKRRGLIKGDWCWHIVADPAKEPGKRLSILTVQPDSYFATYEDELVDGGDPDKLVQVRLVELVLVGDSTLARVQLYDKSEGGAILSSLALWKQEEWFDKTKSPQQVLVPPTPLPDVITAFPVYHIPNGSEGQGGTFGSSEMRGLEVIQAGLNQSVTDEDLALALMGLGVYATDSAGSPTDQSGNPIDWLIYPGAVIQNSRGLRRVEGITSVAPYDSHVGRLEGYLADASGATDAARGRLEVTEAESGIALQIRLSPTLAKAVEKDQIIIDVHNQMFHDLIQMWLPTFEQMNFTDLTVTAVLGDKLPVNRAGEAELVSGLVVAGILSKASARTYLIAKGFTGMFDPTEGDLVLAEQVAEAAAAVGDQTLAGRANTETDPNAGDPNVGA